jgi:hypothetical protein
MSVITEFQEDDIKSNIKLFYIDKLDKTINNTFISTKSLLKDLDGFGSKLKLNTNINIFGDSAYNEDSYSWYTYFSGTKTTYLINTHDIVGNISTITAKTVLSQPLLSTNIIAYGYNDHTYTQTLFTSEKFYTSYVLASYLTCCMPTANLIFGRFLTPSGTWTNPNMTIAGLVGTQYNEAFETSTVNSSLEYNFINIKYCCIAFVEQPGTNAANWDIKINGVSVASHVYSAPLGTSPSTKYITTAIILDCGNVGNYNIKIISQDTNTKYCFWFCGFNVDDAKNYGRPTLVCSIPRVDPAQAGTGTYKRLIEQEEYMKNAIKQCQLMGLPITFYNWSTPDGLFGDVGYKPSITKYKKLYDDMNKYAFI